MSYVAALIRERRDRHAGRTCRMITGSPGHRRDHGPLPMSAICRCVLWVDAVEKGKNELTENFPCEPVETSIWECSGS
jgi:hypothetical protein